MIVVGPFQLGIFYESISKCAITAKYRDGQQQVRKEGKGHFWQCSLKTPAGEKVSLI